MESSTKLFVRFRAALGALLLFSGTGLRGGAPDPAPAGDAPTATSLTTAEIVEKMVSMNEQRAAALESYAATRKYHVEIHGMIDRRADLVVRVVYRRPGRKEFKVVSEEGSKFLRQRVLRELVKAERENGDKGNYKRSAITPENYEFRLMDVQRTPTREFFVLEVVPKTENKFLFRGRIWVDGKDFAIVRIEGEPAKNPSWWITKVNMQHSYEKWGDFWLPARNETITDVRIFGRALLTIGYEDYVLNADSSTLRAEALGKAGTEPVRAGSE